MAVKNTINGIHGQRLKAIRSYINFDFDLRKPLTEYQKRKVREYYNEIDALTARPYYAYRPRIKNRLSKAQEFAQHEKSLPGLKVAFIPTNGEAKPKIRFRKGRFTISTKHVTSRLLQFDKAELVRDPIGHTIDVMSQDEHAKRFTILAGKYEIPNSYARSILPEQIAKLTDRYGNLELNNYFGNWMHGLASHTFKDQADFNEYREAKMQAKIKVKSARRNKKRRNARGKRK